ncbi:MAG: aldo/keto reductase [Alphaproteobacteria bacterium]
MKHVLLPDGTSVPAIGQGTWRLGDVPACATQETEALRQGVSLGMALIDTAEMYGEGRSERLVGRAVEILPRGDVFLVSKVLPSNAGYDRIFRSCDASLKNLGTDYLDLYLLHWRSSVPLEETVAAMEELVAAGKIRRWGVSNFDIDDMEELWSLPDGKNCAVNQVLYHIGSRGVEYSLLPWMRERGIALMAYCPLAIGGKLRRELYGHPVLRDIAAAHHASVPQIMLAFLIRGGGVIAIPRTGNPEHTRENAAAGDIELTGGEIDRINAVLPAPAHKVRLDMQ